MTAWPELRDSDWLLKLGDGHRDFAEYWRAIFDSVHRGERPSVWDYQWLFSIWSRGGIGILPAANLVSNIGFGDDATHTTNSSDWQGAFPLQAMTFPLRHPESVVRDTREDRWIDLNVFQTKTPVGTALRRRLGALVRRLLP
jgi:hypothetical protein